MKLVHAKYVDATFIVKTSSGEMNELSMKVGVHQGSALNLFFLILILDTLRTNSQMKTPWCMLFAADIVLCSE